MSRSFWGTRTAPPATGRIAHLLVAAVLNRRPRATARLENAMTTTPARISTVRSARVATRLTADERGLPRALWRSQCLT